MNVGELYEATVEGSINEIVRVAEARQCKTLGQIADTICARKGVRIILLAGASAAGKTTTAKRLCTQLRVNGYEALMLSTDDYFVGDDRNPRDENGEMDYEHLECVDIPLFTADLNALIKGESIKMRRFDFPTHQGYYSDEELHLPENGYVVIEGIHALNPKLTEGVDDSLKFRVYVEPKTQLNVFASTYLPIEKGRFLRRVVRDNQFRKLSPMVTYQMWPKVIAGEAKWITPFRKFADVEFDSGLCYELAVLKPYVLGPLIKLAAKIENPRDINALIELLDHVPVVSPNVVPGDSILRETIGGSQLDY